MPQAVRVMVRGNQGSHAPLQLLDQWKQMCYQQTHDEGLGLLLLTVPYTRNATSNSPHLCPCFTVVPEATHKANQVPLKGAVGCVS